MTIFILGDSNCIFFHNCYELDSNNKANPDALIKIAWYASHSIWPVTMYQFNNTKLNLFDTATPYYSKEYAIKKNIKKNDYVVFTYGWNDILKNIYKYNKNNYEEFISNMVKKYIQHCIMYKKEYNIIPIIQCIYPNPLIIKSTMNGSHDERHKYIICMNNSLKKECIEVGISFFDIYDILIDNETKCIKEKYISSDGIHLNDKNLELKNKLYNILMDNTI
jgi:lysophospholipase L1-like esterase|tara:strand:+ start:1649 stop:2311 length:663 start_codon:yes stop_codon:yes gene_type:complete